MRSPRNVHASLLVSAVVIAVLSSGCGRQVIPDQLEVKPKAPTVNPGRSGAIAAADMALLRERHAVALYVSAVQDSVQPARTQPDPSPTVTSPAHPVTVAAETSSPWSCIAEAETGSDWSMHGSTYSTAFGVINDIVYQYGTPAEQAAIFSGTASPQTQIDVVSRFANEHGFGGWGVLTKAKCGL